MTIFCFSHPSVGVFFSYFNFLHPKIFSSGVSLTVFCFSYPWIGVFQLLFYFLHSKNYFPGYVANTFHYFSFSPNRWMSTSKACLKKVLFWLTTIKIPKVLGKLITENSCPTPHFICYTKRVWNVYTPQQPRMPIPEFPATNNHQYPKMLTSKDHLQPKILTSKDHQRPKILTSNTLIFQIPLHTR